MTRATRTLAAASIAAVVFAASLPAQSTGSAAPETEWYIGVPIRNFAFKGLVTVKADDLQTMVKPYVGRKFSLDLLWEIQASLFALDSFETIEPNALPADDSRTEVVIEFVVKERPEITAIEVKGNRGVGTGDITDKILLKKGDLAVPARLTADVASVNSLYLEKGYTDVTVKGSFEPGDGEGTVKAVFDITEGMPTTIKEVRFSGNAFAAESTLRGLMKTKPQFLFDPGVFQESKLEEDKAAIVSYYTDHGFVDVKIEKVTRDVQEQEGRKYLVITVYLSEGDQWTYGGLSITGNQVFSSEKLSALVYQKPGRIVSLQKLQADVSRISDLYMENGYIFNKFEKKESRDPAARTITYQLAITEYDKAHIEKIIFKGNTKTQEYVLRRELPFEEGEIFNKSRIIQGLQNLINLQYFKTVEPEAPPGSAFGLMNVVFNVEETSTADIKFGIVFSGGDFPISGTLGWNEKNFMGRGQTVGVDLEASPAKQSVALSYFEPWMLGVPWSLGTSVSFQHSSMQNVPQDVLPPIFPDAQASIAAPDPYVTRDEYLAAIARGESIPSQYLMRYDALDFGFGITTGYRFRAPLGWLGVRGGFTPQLRYIGYDETLYRPFEKNIRDNNKRWSFIDKLSLTGFLDGRDIAFRPMNGFYASQSVTLTGGFLFGDRHYIRTDSTVEGFLTLLDLPVFENWNLQFVLAAHSAVSLILPQFAFASSTGQWQWQTTTDFTDQLYIDGMTVGRGWRQMYGNALWDNKLELRMPIAREAIWAIGFFDAAALWNEPQDMASMVIDQFFFSFGLGLRFTIPQFPIRLYLGKGFQVKNGQVVWKDGDLKIGDLSLSFIISLGGDAF